jgi:hypothetical protein
VQFLFVAMADAEDRSLSKYVKWDGERKGFRSWYKFIRNRAVISQGLVRRIVMEQLTLMDYMTEDGADEDEYVVANAKVFQLVGEPLMQHQSSTAYSLLAGIDVGDGLSLLGDFLVYFDGRTEEEVEDLEDQWRDVSFQSDGVVNLATYLSLHADYVLRLNQSGANISRTKAFRRVLKQLPQQYAVVRQSLSTQLEPYAIREAEGANDPEVTMDVMGAIREFTRRLKKFNYDENLEKDFQVKGLLNLSVPPGESLNYVGRTKLSRDQCAKCLQPGHWARDCRNRRHADSTWKDRSGKGGDAKGTSKQKNSGGKPSKKVKCWNCGEKGHVSNKCPKKNTGSGSAEGANQAQEDKNPDVFDINVLEIDQVDRTDESDTGSSCKLSDELSDELLVDELVVDKFFGPADEFGRLDGVCDDVANRIVSIPVDDQFDMHCDHAEDVSDDGVSLYALLNVSQSLAGMGYVVVDSGATTSSEPDSKYFVTLDAEADVRVNTAGGQIGAAGMGGVRWSFLDEDNRPVSVQAGRVLHLPKAERLLSVWQCVQQGHSVVFEPGGAYLQLKGGSKIPFQVQGKYWVIPLQGNTHGVEYCLWKRVLQAPVSTALAHRRLGHASEWQMQMMKQLGLVRGMTWQGPFPHNCKICREFTFPLASEALKREKEDAPGALISFDFWIPPMKTAAMFSVKAVLGFRDASTGMPFVYPLSTKADLPKQCDVWYRTEVAPNAHVKLVACCCDHENVNLTTGVREWFASKGVKFVPSPPHMKGRTNIIEAFWRPLIAKVRAMLGDQDLASFYFPAAVVKAAKLMQILPSKANLGCSSPYVLWHRKLPFGGYLRVWGSRCVTKDFKVKDKLHQQAQSGRFMIDDESSAWKVMLDKSRSLAVSPHVRFDERSAAQVALDDQVGEMAAVRDFNAQSDDDLVSRLEQAPRGKVPAMAGGSPEWLDAPVQSTAKSGGNVEFEPDVASVPPEPDVADELVVNRPAEVRRSGRVRNAPDQFIAEAGGRKSAPDRTREERRALYSSPDLVNLQATSLADYYTPCEGVTMVSADFGHLGVHVCGDVQCAKSAGLFFLDAEFPGERAQCSDDDFSLFSLDEELNQAKVDKRQHGQGSHVIIDQEAERLVDFVPKNDKEAAKSPAWCASAWRQLQKFEKHGSARVVPDVGQRRGLTIWVRVNKKDAQGNVIDNYSRLAIRGDLEVAGLDYDVDDISTFVAEDAHIKILIGAMAVNGWAAFEGDADGAFHQGKPSRPTFVKLPWLPNVKPKPGFLWEILTCVYGKVEAAARFNDKLIDAQASVQQHVTRSDSAIYVRKSQDGKRLVSVCTSHIDDMVEYATSGDMKEAEAAMRDIGKVVKLKEKSLRPLQFMLGRSVHYLPDGAVAIMRRAKIDQMVDDHSIDGSSKQPAKTSTDFHTVVTETEQQKRESQQKPLRELVGMQQYIATDRRDIAFVVNNLSRYVAPQLRQQKHWYQARLLGGYLKRTRNWAQVFGRNLSVEDRNKLIMFVDSEWCGINGTRFTYGCFIIMWNGGVVAMKSFVIKLVCSSTCEAEYVALSEGCKKLRQLSMFCEELCFPQGNNKVFCDNEAAVAIAKNNGASRGKHIDIRYHFVKDHVKWGFIDLRGVKSQDNPADIGTKCQPLDLFAHHVNMMGIMDISKELKQLGFKG